MTKFQSFQLWINRNYTIIRNTLLTIFGIVLLLSSLALIQKQGELSGRIESLSQQNVQLNRQNKTLSQQLVKTANENQDLAKQNRAYTRCGFQIFAKYTRDNMPVSVLNLDTCQVGNQADNKINIPTTGEH